MKFLPRHRSSGWAGRPLFRRSRKLLKTVIGTARSRYTFSDIVLSENNRSGFFR